MAPAATIFWMVSMQCTYRTLRLSQALRRPIVDHMGDTGIIIAGSDNTLSNSRIAYSSGNGVTVSGSGNKIINNLIHDVDYIGNYTSGITLLGQVSMPQNTVIQHNTIYSVGRQAIVLSDGGGSVSGADIGYNNLFNGMLLSRDGGEYMRAAEPHSREQDSTIIGSMTHKPNYQGRRTTTRTAEFIWIMESPVLRLTTTCCGIINTRISSYTETAQSRRTITMCTTIRSQMSILRPTSCCRRFQSAEQQKWLTIEFLSRWTM